MPRVEGWETRLADAIKSARDRLPLYGEYDCCLFVADMVATVIGEDPAVRFRGVYSNIKGAKAALMEHGGGTVEGTAEMIAAEIGAAEIAPAFAQRGDFGFISTEAMEGYYGAVMRDDGFDGLLAVNYGAEWLAAAAGRARGWMAVDGDVIKRAWHI